ncbi:MAG TPA: hypothetical protein V6D22_17065 [Candidatus Obscuribacterales bacterium]
MTFNRNEYMRGYMKKWRQTPKGKAYRKRERIKKQNKKKAANRIRARNKKNRLIRAQQYRQNCYCFFVDFIGCWDQTKHGNFLTRDKLPMLQDLLDRALVLRRARITVNKVKED